MLIPRPQANEYFEYYGGYVNRVPDGDILAILEGQLQKMRDAFLPLSDERAAYRFGDGEWSIKQMLGHMNDGEQVFGFRLMAFSRGESQAIPGFEQDEYVANANFDAIPVADLVAQFEHLRHANLLTIRHLTPEMVARRGVASGKEITVRALIYILAGHVEHHLASLVQDYGVKN
ncbi:MAG: DinB family protein [Anaerolineae bacterium]|nr:DinB family protein [Anaerolineae bacterium]